MVFLDKSVYNTVLIKACISFQKGRKAEAVRHRR
jgi:hypothetical protein